MNRSLIDCTCSQKIESSDDDTDSFISKDSDEVGSTESYDPKDGRHSDDSGSVASESETSEVSNEEDEEEPSKRHPKHAKSSGKKKSAKSNNDDNVKPSRKHNKSDKSNGNDKSIKDGTSSAFKDPSVLLNKFYKPGSGISILKPLVSVIKHKGYQMVLLPRGGDNAWWLNERFVQTLVEIQYDEDKKNSKKQNSRKPEWLSTFFKVIIRKEPHGNNMYKADQRRNFISHIGFVYDFIVGQKTPEEMQGDIESIVRYIYNAMCQFCNEDTAGEHILNFMKDGEDQPFLYNHFIDTNYGGKLQKVHDKLQRNLRQFSEHVPRIDPEHYHLDYFLPDYDIKAFAERVLGVNSWKDQAIKGANLEACYKEKARKGDVPKWGDIQKQPVKRYTSDKDGGSYD